jgi:DNA-binding MarR family transcriptional regulator
MAQLHIVGSDGEHGPSQKAGPSMDELAAMLAEISRHLNDASARLQIATELQTPARHDVHSTIHVDVKRARTLRSLRRKLLGDDFFTGPGWGLLLHLFESHLQQTRATVGAACDGADAAPSTALRWIGKLEADGLIVMRDDPLDARRRFVELTPHAVELMTKYFAGASAHGIAA